MFGSTDGRLTRWAKRGGTVAALAGFSSLALTGAALAHHATIQAGVDCSGVVSYTTSSWDPGKLDGENPDIGIYYHVGSDINWASAGSPVATGAFTATQTSFSGTFTIPNFVPSDSLDVGTRADGVWGDGDAAHETQDTGLFSLTTSCTPPATQVTPSAPNWTDSVCQSGVPSTPTYTIPDTKGVVYYDDKGNVLSAGSHNAAVGDTVTVTAKPATGYTFGADASETYTHTFAAPDCTSHVTVKTPTATDQSCAAGSPGQTSSGFITIPSEPGVDYFINGSAASSGNVDETPGSYTVTAKAEAGYTLSGTTSFWLTIGSAGDCTVTATPVAPTATDASCASTPGAVNSGYITIPTTTGVDYYIDGTKVSAGKSTEAPGTYTVTATAQSGYVLTGTSSFTEKINGAGDCTTHVSAVAPIASGQNCTAAGVHSDGTITLTAVTGVDYAIDGTPANAGTITELPGTYTVTATAAQGYTLDGTSSFTVTIQDAGSCLAHATPATPTVLDQVCTGPGVHADGSITLAAVTGVDYQVNGIATAPGTYTEAPGTYTVTATPQVGYTFDGTTSFTETVTAAGACLVPATPVVPTINQSVCQTGIGPSTPTYTVVGTTGLEFLNGTTVVMPGTYNAVAGTTVTLTVQPLPGYTLPAGVSSSIPLSFTSPAGCAANPAATVVTNCTTNVVTVSNTGVLPVTFTLTPTKGAPVTITVAPGGTATRSFPSSAGTVTVTAPGLATVTHTAGKKCVPPTQVLGKHVNRHPRRATSVAADTATQLPFTGLPTGMLVLLALIAIATGVTLTVIGAQRRPSKEQA